MIIDAKNLVLGRLASVAAKKALLGNIVDIVNCEQAIVSGSRENVLAKYRRKRRLGGPFRGPFIPRKPDFFVRRVIRGMLPYKQYKGRKAFERIKCHIGVPEKFMNQGFETIEANLDSLSTLKFVTIQDLCQHLGSKI